MTQPRPSAPASIRHVQSPEHRIAQSAPEQARLKAALDRQVPGQADDAERNSEGVGKTKRDDVDRAEDGERPAKQHGRKRLRWREKKWAQRSQADAHDRQGAEQGLRRATVQRNKVDGEHDDHPSPSCAYEFRHAEAIISRGRLLQVRRSGVLSMRATRASGQGQGALRISLAAGALAFSMAQTVSAATVYRPGSSPPEAIAGGGGEREELTKARSMSCLAAAIYYEAANQSVLGREAVAQVVLNRVNHPAYPKSVCGVVYQGAPSSGCQFSFACDGSMTRQPELRAWRAAEEIARRALNGGLEPTIGSATHYHAFYVHPAWSDTLTEVSQIGAHLFYTLPGQSLDRTRKVGGLRADLAINVQSAPSSQVRAATRRAPRSAPFAVWGLTVATAAPERSGAVSVISEPGA